MVQHIDAARLFRLIHFECIHLALCRAPYVKALTIGGQLRIHPAEAVEVEKMLLLIEQLLPVVLAVDVE